MSRRDPTSSWIPWPAFVRALGEDAELASFLVGRGMIEGSGGNRPGMIRTPKPQPPGYWRELREAGALAQKLEAAGQAERFRAALELQEAINSMEWDRAASRRSQVGAHMPCIFFSLDAGTPCTCPFYFPAWARWLGWKGRMRLVAEPPGG